MPILIGKEETYASLRPFLPEDAKRILEEQIPKIQSQVDAEIDRFVQGISEHLQQQLEQLAAAAQTDATNAQRKLDDIMANLARSQNDGAELIKAATELRSVVQAYNDKWTGLGQNVRKAALTAARSVGLPIPDLTNLLPGKPRQG